MTTSVELDHDGGIVVVKRAGPDLGVDRLRHESEVLGLARHPGVVELVAAFDATEPAVITRWVGPHTVDGMGSLSLHHVAAVMAALADCVADLHDMGISHGAIEPAHVLLSPDGRPVLCSFGAARVAEPGVAPLPTALSDDVASLGCVMRSLAGEDVEIEPIPERRGWRRRPRWQGYQRRALLNLADQATQDDLLRRPTARAFAAAIHDTIPDARIGPLVAPPVIPSGVGSEPRKEAAARPLGAGSLRIGGAPEPDPLLAVPAPSPHRRVGLICGVVAGAVAATLSLIAVTRGNAHHTATSAATSAPVSAPARTSGPSRPASPKPKPTPTPKPPPTRQAAKARRRANPPRRCTPVDGVDLDADGCPDRVRVSSAAVEAAGTKYAIGRAGDRIVVGDWGCTGRATPALLRPATGEVFVFGTWATPGRAVTIHPTARVPEAVTLEAPDLDGDGCTDLRVRTAGNRLVAVATPQGTRP